MLPTRKPERLEFNNPAHKEWAERIGRIRELLEALTKVTRRRRNKKYRNRPPAPVLCRICDKYIKSGHYRIHAPIAAHEPCYIATVNAVEGLLGTPTQTSTERNVDRNACLF